MKRTDAASRPKFELETAARHDLLGALAAGGLVLVFSLLLVWHDPNVFWKDDYQISILPVFADIARSWSEGTWPLLSPYSWVCSNLAGEFQYGTFSLFVNAAVIAIWKFPLEFAQQAAALSITHLVALAMGAYLLARGRELSVPLAMLVALVSSANGWIIWWGASDWFGALAAFAWLPWSWWALEKAMRRGGPRWRLLLPAPFIYLLVAGGFPYTLIMLALVTAWLALRALVQDRDWLALVRLGTGWILGLGLSAPAWIALLEYAPGSRRSEEVFLPKQWLVPITGLPGLVLPDWTVVWSTFEEMLVAHPATELACGLAPVVIIVAVLLTQRRIVSELRWEFTLLVLVLAFSMLPSAGIFRFSFRWLPLFHLTLALTAAECLQRWNAASACEREWFRSNPGAWSFALVAGVCGMMLAFGLTSPRSSGALPVAALFASAFWWIGHALLSRSAARWLPLGVAFITLLATYTSLRAQSEVSRYWFTKQLRSPAPLDPTRLYLSLYLSPQSEYREDITGMPFGATTRPGSTSMWGAVHLINGYSPVSPAGIARLLDFGTHGQINPARVREIVLPEAGPDGLLAKLGIDGIILDHKFWLEEPLRNEWASAFSDDEAQVFHRLVPLPHVRVLDADTGSGAAVRLIENTRHRVIAEITPN
ncbi:MAG TPA: hypothetical protein VF683_05570, partial [Chthoniobacterales bacterium]